jgi:hypothetical protein
MGVVIEIRMKYPGGPTRMRGADTLLYLVGGRGSKSILGPATAKNQPPPMRWARG